MSTPYTPPPAYNNGSSSISMGPVSSDPATPLGPVCCCCRSSCSACNCCHWNKWSCGRRCCAVFCIVLLIVVIVIASLVPYLTKVPSVAYTSSRSQCVSPQCTTDATIPYVVMLTVTNDNIIGAYAEVAEMHAKTTTDSPPKELGPGSIPKTWVKPRGKTELTATFQLNKANIVGNFFSGSYRARVTGDVKVSLGSLSYTVSFSETFTVNN